jgi:hypothetical protein
MSGSVGKVIAGCFSLAAFATAIVVGLAAENAATAVLTRALVAMIVCYPVGLVIGVVCDHVIQQQVEAHVRANPLPDGAAAGDDEQSGSGPDEEVIEV